MWTFYTNQFLCFFTDPVITVKIQIAGKLMDTMDDAESKLQCLWNKFLSLENDYNEVNIRLQWYFRTLY